MLKVFTALSVLLATQSVQTPTYYSNLAVESGVLNMRMDYAPLTCASLHIANDCYDTLAEAWQAQLTIAAYEGDEASVEYYTQLLEAE